MHMVFCDGWLQCFSNQEWGPGLMLMGIQMGGVVAYFSNPAPPWQTHRELNPPKSIYAISYLLSYMPQLYFCHWQRQKHICFTDERTSWNKRRKSWHTSWCQNLRVPQCLVYRCLCSTTVKYLRRQPKESCFLPPAITIETDFIYEILSKDVGRETSWQILRKTSGCLWQWKTFLMSMCFRPSVYRVNCSCCAVLHAVSQAWSVSVCICMLCFSGQLSRSAVVSRTH